MAASSGGTALTPRSVVPWLMSLALVGGVVALGWRALRAWEGAALAIGGGVCGAYVLWLLWEGRVGRRDARAPSVRADRWTGEIYALAQGATALTALLRASHGPPPLAVQLGGALAFAAGLALRVAAVRALGRHYSHRVRITERHALVTTGPYRVLRHPAYAGMLLVHVGFVGAFFDPIALALLVAALLPAIVWRIRVEERALAALPGYAAFCRTRRRLVPGLW